MLIGNFSVIAKQVSHNIGGQTQTDRSNWNRTGQMRNWGHKEDGNWDMVAIPQGTGAVTGWFLPVIAGEMVANQTARISVSATANGTMGLPTTGDASITFTVDDAVGQMVMFGTGSSTISFSTNAPFLTSFAPGTGSATITFSVADAMLGAEASLTGNASCSFSASGNILPLDSDIPILSAHASFSFSGSLVPYAVGIMSGSTVSSTDMSPQSFAIAVWRALATDNNDAGTMGNKVNTASSGGVDMSALAEAVVSALNSTTIPVNAVAIKGQLISGSGTEIDPWGP